MASSQPSAAGIWMAKLSLRICSILFAIVAIGMAAYYATIYAVIGTVLMMAPPCAVAIAWDCIDGIALCVRRGHRGLPHASIVLDFILTLGLGGVSIMMAVISNLLRDSGYYIAYYPPNDVGAEHIRVSAAFGLLAAIMHLVCFILAIRDLMAGEPVVTAPQVVYVAAGQETQNMGGAAMAELYQQQQQARNDPPPKYSPPDQISQVQQPQELEAGKLVADSEKI